MQNEDILLWKVRRVNSTQHWQTMLKYINAIFSQFTSALTGKSVGNIHQRVDQRHRSVISSKLANYMFIEQRETFHKRSCDSASHNSSNRWFPDIISSSNELSHNNTVSSNPIEVLGTARLYAKHRPLPPVYRVFERILRRPIPGPLVILGFITEKFSVHMLSSSRARVGCTSCTPSRRPCLYVHWARSE